MKLPFFSKPAGQRDYYLGLFLKEEEGILFIIRSLRGRIEISETEKFTYSNGWENLDSDVDELLYRMEKTIGETVSKTIFFVYSHLIDEHAGDIKQPYLTKIKELVKNLELTALGYIECIEAASRLVQNKENIPATAIFVELDRHDLSLFVYKGGKAIKKISLARTDSITDDLLLGLTDLKGQSLLPSKIILYDGLGLDDAAEKILSFRFEENYFVQLPKVDILTEGEIIRGLVEIFGEQTAGVKVEEVKPEREESFGFLINEDIQDRKTEPASQIKKPTFVMPNIKIPVLPSFPKLNLSFISGKIAAIVGVVIIVVSLLLNEYFFHQADLKVYLAADVIEKEVNFELDYTIATESARLNNETVATGQRQIGDPTRGQVTLHNFDDTERTFAKGTVITTAALNFILDNEIKVASSSLAADGSAKLPGKKNGSITAFAIGPEGNLAKGTRFTIEGLSDSLFFAINEAALAGGTKKTIKTVAAADQEKLEKVVLATARKQVKTPFGAKSEILSTLTQTNISQANFSKEVGEEADSVTIDAEVETTFYLYDKDGLMTSIQEELKDDVKEGFIVNRPLINYKVNESNLNEDKIIVSLSVSAKSIKKTSPDEIIASVKGRNKNNLSVLKDKFGVEAYDLKIREPIPFLNNFLPFFKKNINLSVLAR